MPLTPLQVRQRAMDIGIALAQDGIDAERNPEGKGLAHAAWMAQQITTEMHSDPGKAERWYGYLQAILVYEGAATLDEERERNRVPALVESEDDWRARKDWERDSDFTPI